MRTQFSVSRAKGKTNLATRASRHSLEDAAYRRSDVSEGGSQTKAEYSLTEGLNLVMATADVRICFW